MRLFPYEQVRDGQKLFMEDVYSAVSSGKCLVAHAPTGLGKTAAALSPALELAIEKGLTVFFLTSRQTQHAIAVETLARIRHKARFAAIDIVGKKNMCAQPGVQDLPVSQFHEYCRSLRQNNQCRFYTNLRRSGEISNEAQAVVSGLKADVLHSEQAVELGKKWSVCPYEAAALASSDASVIIADYYYLFHPKIREGFLRKTGKSLQESIIIIDEGHNLPDRMREMLTSRISSFALERAAGEAKRAGGPMAEEFISSLRRAVSSNSDNDGERIVKKADLTNALNGFDIVSCLKLLETIADSVREEDRQSYCGSVADFVSAWVSGSDDGFARIFSRAGRAFSLSFKCLDPGIETGKVIAQAHSVVIMSGTLLPTSMYREILGFPEGTVERQYRNPFPRGNRLPMIINSVTTQYSLRSDEEFRRIAEVCIQASREIPGNMAVYFPSYQLLGEVHRHLYGKVGKLIFTEMPNISKEDKARLLSDYKACFLRGGLLMAVIGGSFSEGIDLPGNLLNGVLIVGLPLAQPDLYTSELIRFYDTRYGKGWDYGYVFPAFTKALQSAGRCIRSENDRGAMLFLDRRYAWPRYYSLFPGDLRPTVTREFVPKLRDFFKPQ